MKAVILNSGMGSRMGAFTKNCHKGLLDIGGETLFVRQINILRELGVSDFIITTGEYDREFRKAADGITGIEAVFVNNPLCRSTNYIYSLFLAREHIPGDVSEDIIYLHGDLYFTSDAAERLLASPAPSACLINRDVPLPEKDFKGRLEGEYIREISVSLTPENIPAGQKLAALQPFYKLSGELMEKWLCRISDYVSRGETSVYAENALNELLSTEAVTGVSWGDSFISEIDTPADYENVKAACHRSHSL